MNIAEQIASNKNPSITINPQNGWDSSQEDSAGFLNDSTNSKKVSQRTIDFGRKSSRSNFALTVAALQHTHKMALSNSENNKTNIRTLYYDLKSELIPDLSINKVNQAVKNVEQLLGCTGWDAGYTTTSKGLLAGDVTLKFSVDKTINYNKSSGYLIPQEVFDLTLEQIETTADFVLVVEKDTIFQKLLGDTEQCPKELNCILITGKGEPDRATRCIVKLLAEGKKLPTFILVDSDPYGFEIMCTYRFGSKDYKNLAAPSALWIGIFPGELKSMGITELIPLKETDVKKTNSLKTRSDVSRNLRKQLRILEKVGKADIERIANLSRGFLTLFYLRHKIKLKHFL